MAENPGETKLRPAFRESSVQPSWYRLLISWPFTGNVLDLFRLRALQADEAKEVENGG